MRFVLFLLIFFMNFSFAKDSDVNVCKSVDVVKSSFKNNKITNKEIEDLIKKDKLVAMKGKVIDLNTISFWVQNDFIYFSSKNIDEKTCEMQMEDCVGQKIEHESFCFAKSARLSLKFKNGD